MSNPVIDEDGYITEVIGSAVIRRLPDAVHEPMPEPRIITVYALKARLGKAARIAIRSAAKVDDEVLDFQDMLDSATVVDLDDQDLIESLQALELAGLIVEGDSERILTTPIQSVERPGWR